MSSVAQFFRVAGATIAPPPGLPLPQHSTAAVEMMSPPPGLSLLPPTVTMPPPGLCHSLLSLRGGNEVDQKLAHKVQRSGSADLDSQCSTADTAEASEASEAGEDVGLVSPETLADVGYHPGLVLRKEARIDVPAPPCLISLADTIEEPQREGGMPGCPSVGSAGHHLGLCKPCDFVYRGSCRSGTACKFCHLCPPEATKERKKERRKLLRSMASMARVPQADQGEAQRDLECGACVGGCNKEKAKGFCASFRSATLGGA